MEYHLIDFGGGRRLESIGTYVIDRPCAAAEGIHRRDPQAWHTIGARYISDRDRREWQFSQPWPEDLALDADGFRLPARPTPFGHIGFFPEQQSNWRWIQETICAWPSPRVLNLFAYTGGSTLAAASAGATVTHVDAARPNVAAARRAAEASGMVDAPIRYLVEDASKFVAREQRRGNRYDLIVLDPPAYGHGGRGRAWRLERDLWPLLEGCLQLLQGERGGILLSGHSPSIGHREATQWFARHRKPSHISGERAVLRSRDGRMLDAGFQVRVLWH